MKTSAIAPSLRRRTTAASAALLLGLTLAACGGGDESDDAGDDSSSSATETTSATDEPTSDPTSESTSEPVDGVPTEAELVPALLTPADLPEGFVVGPDDGDDDEDEESGLDDTCIGDIGQFSDALGAEPDSEAEVELAAEGQTGQSFVASQVEAYADPSGLAPAFADFTGTLQSCTSVETTDADGVTYSLQIGYDDTVDLPGADDQIRVQMTGTISSGAETFDVTYRYVVGVLGQFISIVGVYALNEDTTGVLDSIDDLAVLQAERVAEIG